ncbi:MULTISPECIES: hypothetical protein [unclassified Streptomyces]|uniref:hypothetical protein n=1 Tax=unclassified Streptomyces TaxID=2593676 RepID=UPI0006F21B3C|nr:MULTISPECIES: hypothetical protein [unclassified Streptomyces]KQX59118.1 hypothetical protein ASD33_02135 [Streptomyces sp. Root1304]KRB00379.1 hypothetical protein ASE09_02135 [Streptomyces sp. Root66D1]
MERAGGEPRPSITVDNGPGVVVIGDGNRVVNGTPPAVRSAYREQVRRIAPPELVGREAELVELAEFCRADSGPAYAYWRAEAWAGKTALMAWFALDPPPGVRIVPFFVTARLGAQNDVAAYTDVVLEQLAELAGEGLPALLTAATREAHLLRLYTSAAEACAARGERLVLLVDGLDEDRGVTTGADARSIAGLLPYGLRVIVSGRPNPPLPADVPENHPLRDPAVVRPLAPSPSARAIRVEAERELKRLLEAGGLPYELLALVTAAGGGLTADDLAELTGAVPYRVRDVLRTGPGRTFARRSEAYLLAHEELVVRAREMLGDRELDRWRAVLHDWAGRRRERGWPDDTPDYLLHGYVPMLRAAGDAERLVACAVDERRHARLLAVTGGDAAALAEIGAAEDAVLGRAEAEGSVVVESAVEAEGSVVAALRLATARAALLRGSGSVPVSLLAGWVAVGRPDRAVALARSLEGDRVVEGLCVVAEKLLDAGERERAEALADEAEPLTRGFTDITSPAAGDALPLLLVRLGAPERAERLVRAHHSRVAPRSRRMLADLLLAAGRYRRAGALVESEQDPATRPVLRSAVVAALVRDGRIDEAVNEACFGGEEELGGRVAVMLRASVALRAAGHRDAAEGVLRLATRRLARMDRRQFARFGGQVIAALFAAGETEAARAVGAGKEAFSYAAALAEYGRWDEALEVAGTLDDHNRETLRGRVARGLARAGAVERALALAPERGPGRYSDDTWPALAEALLARGDLEAVAPLCARLVAGPDAPRGRSGRSGDGLRVLGALLRRLLAEGAVDRARAVMRELGENTEGLAVFAEELYRAGHVAEARRLLAAEERRVRVPARAALAGDLVALARGLAEAGRREEAVDLLRAVENEPGVEPRDAALVALAAGRWEWAETFIRAAPWSLRRELFRRLYEAYAAEGEFDRVLRLVGDPGTHENFGQEAAVAFAAVGARERAEKLMSGRPAAPNAVEVYARMALACGERGRREDAEHYLAAARARELDGPASLPLLRAECALAPENAAALGAACFARFPWQRTSPVALVVTGSCDEVVARFREFPHSYPGRWSVTVVTELLRTARYDHAAALLDGMHHVGPPCGEAYALLARAEPDPVRARRWAVLALRLGERPVVLPAVLDVAPEAVPLVLDEAARLRRALQV